MAKTSAGEVIELHLDDQFVLERLPFHGVLRAPATQAAGGFAGEAGRLDQFLQLFREERPFFGADGGTKADVVEQSFVVVESEQ